MKRNIYSFIIFSLTSYIVAREDYSIIFVHLGTSLPNYAITAIEQARLFNADIPIFLITNKVVAQNILVNKSIKVISCEELNQSTMHLKFMRESSLNRLSLEGFWLKTTERFFYLEELASYLNLENIFHLETDVMLYVNLSTILTVFKTYKNIAAIFDNDKRGIASFIYFANSNSLKKFVTFIAENSHVGLNDMEILVHYKKHTGIDEIDHLPILSELFVTNNQLSSILRSTVHDKYLFCNKFKEFNSVFDAAAIGQYLGGISPRNGTPTPGFVNESCVFDPSKFSYKWIKDESGRNVPYLSGEDGEYRINNLHIHSKNLELFKS